PPPHRIHRPEHPPSHRLIHNRHARHPRPVLLVNRSPKQNRYAQRLKISGRFPRRGRAHHLRSIHFNLAADARTNRRATRQERRLHSRNRRNPPLHLFVDSRRLRFSVSRIACTHRHQRHTVNREPRLRPPHR